jgi:toxin ParE1/3/4
MPTYVIAPGALQDIDEIIMVIKEESRSDAVAEKWLSGLIRKCQHLSGFPRTGRVRTEFCTDARVFPYNDYLIFYDIASYGVDIVHVIHGARDVPRLFAKSKVPSEDA